MTASVQRIEGGLDVQRPQTAVAGDEIIAFGSFRDRKSVV